MANEMVEELLHAQGLDDIGHELRMHVCVGDLHMQQLAHIALAA
jgi:hypothetical protein